MLKNHKHTLMMKKWIVLFAVWGFAMGLDSEVCQAQKNASMDTNQDLPCRFIYQINVNIKSKRPDRNGEPFYQYALLYTCKDPNAIEVQRQVITVKWKEKTWHREMIRVEKTFDTEEDALAYAEMNQVPMTWFKDDRQRVDYVVSLRENGLSPTDIRSDLAIQTIEKMLPKDWELVQTAEQKKVFPQTFTIQAKYKLWKTNLNLINASESAIKNASEESFIKKNGKQITPYITFSLHKPWRPIELKNVEYTESTWQYYYANAQYFGLKVVAFEGLGGKFEQVYPPKEVQITPMQVYDQIKQFLTPKTFKGKAQNAKMGAILIEEKTKTVYLIDDRKGNLGSWDASMLGKEVVVEGIAVSKIVDNGVLMNDKGEYKAGVDKGEQKMLVNVMKEKIRYQSGVVGVAQQANLGKVVGVSNKEDNIACIITENKEVIYIEGLSEWQKYYQGKKVLVKGFLEQRPVYEPYMRTDPEKGNIVTKERKSTLKPFLVGYQMAKLEESVSLVVIFKKEIAKAKTIEIMEKTLYPYWEGMDSSKGKIYFQKTGEKYHVVFTTEAEREQFLQQYKSTSEIYEIYKPDWDIQKD